MWVWGFNIVFFQCVPDDKKNIRRVFVFAIINPIDPKFDGKLDATFPETAQFAIRWKWIVKDLWVFGNGGLDQCRDRIYIGVITDGKIGFIAVCATLVRIIDNTGCDEIFVWNNNSTSVIRFKDHRTGRGFHDCACFTAIKFDIIPNGCLSL